jgi:hypothetical protein
MGECHRTRHSHNVMKQAEAANGVPERSPPRASSAG